MYIRRVRAFRRCHSDVGVLPQWCGLLLIVCLPIAVVLGDHGGGITLGLVWLALGYVLLSQRDVSALVGGSETR